MNIWNDPKHRSDYYKSYYARVTKAKRSSLQTRRYSRRILGRVRELHANGCNIICISAAVNLPLDAVKTMINATNTTDQEHAFFTA